MDELQGKIAQLQEHVMRLRRENEDLKNEITKNAPQYHVDNKNEKSRLHSLEISDNRYEYQVYYLSFQALKTLLMKINTSLPYSFTNLSDLIFNYSYIDKQGVSLGINDQHVPTTQLLNGDVEEVAKNISSVIVPSQRGINVVAFAPNDNSKYAELDTLENRNIATADGPDSTCLEMGNNVQDI